MGRLTALLLAGFALALGVAACGGDDASKGPDQAAFEETLCHPPGRVLDLHNSGIPCEQAGATLVLLAAGATGPQTVRAEDGTWTCRDFTGPRGKGKKCSNGDRFFTAERTDPEP